MSSTPLRSDEVILGFVLSSFGIQGEFRIFLANRETDLFSSDLAIELVSPTGLRLERVLRIRPGAGKRILGRIKGITDKDAADALKDWEIRIAKDRLPDLDDDVYYHHELLGTEVETESGLRLGTISEVYSAGGVDCWVVRNGGSECYVAAIRENVIEVRRGVKVVVANHVAEVL